MMGRRLIFLAAVLALAAFAAGVAHAAVPNAPTGATATAGDTQATVHWHQPSAPGGTITGYTVTAAPGGATCAWSSGPLICTVTGLTNGTHYSFTVTATNGSGTGPASAASNTVTPAAPPGAPTHVVATAGDAQATVTWTAPASNGGATITSYTVTASGSGGQTCSWSSGALSCIVTGLVNGTSYTFTVTATNDAATGAASTASAAVTPTGAPAPPTGISATAGDQQATVTCTAPANTGGAAITSYTATASPGGAHASAKTCPITVTGLADGTAYTFTVTATTSLGTSARSAASNTVTPLDTHPPSVPTSLIGAFSHGSLVLVWQAAVDNVGIARYAVYLNGVAIASVTGSTQATTHAIQPKGRSVYTVRAFDAAGNESGPSGTVIVAPRAVPAIAKSVPSWAWKFLAWQQHGQKGVRPKTPKPLPSWYAGWKRWRLEPFQIVQ